MNLVKSLEFVDPSKVHETIHIIGVGSVGSMLADHLSRFGFSRFKLYDFDKVEEKNIVNQLYTTKDIGQPKVEAMRKHLLDVNPDCKIRLESEGWEKGMPLDGYVFLCVDSIETRRAIVEDNMYNPSIVAVFDFRTALTEAQHYAASWSVLKDKKALLASMQYSDEEAKKETPLTACGTEMGIPTTVRLVVDFGVANFISFIKDNKLTRFLPVSINIQEVLT